MWRAASRPDLIWIIHGYVADVHAFYAIREKKKKMRTVARIRNALLKTRPVASYVSRNFMWKRVAFEITTDRVFQRP